jgi:hypothetical protein
MSLRVFFLVSLLTVTGILGLSSTVSAQTTGPATTSPSTSQGPSTASSSTSSTKTNSESVPDQVLDQLVKEFDTQKKKAPGHEGQIVLSPTTYIPYLVAPAVTAKLLNVFQEQRVDVQVTSSQSAASSTSTTNTGSVPWLFGLAVEAGALTQSTSNGQIVLRGNVANAISAMKYQNYITSFDKIQEQNSLIRNIAATSISVTFSPSTATNTTAAPKTQKDNFSGFSVHYDIWNHRDPRDLRWRTKWASSIMSLAKASNSAQVFLDAFENLPSPKGAPIDVAPPFGSRSATYVSGGTVTGSKGQTCTLSDFDGVPGAEASVTLTGDNAIASGTAVAVTRQGGPTTGVPTTARLGNGTASCGGTAVLQVLLQTPSSQWQSLATAQFNSLSSSAADDEIRAMFKTLGDDLAAKVKTSPQVMAAAQGDVSALIDAGEEKVETYTDIMKSPTLSFEYDYVRQSTNQIPGSTSTTTNSAASPLPNLSTFNLIYNTSFLARSQLSLNGVATIFNSLPVGAKGGTIRDVELTAQLDIPLPPISSIGKPTLTFSGLYMDLINQPLGQPLLVNGAAESRTGNIGLFQTKFTIPASKGSGVSIPLSFTFSNRSELIKESDVRGSIGVTFNLDSIFSKP